MGWDESCTSPALRVGCICVVYEANAYQGGEHYQSAFYVYEELASAPSTSAALSIVGQAVAEMHLGRLPEAEAALSMALEKYPDDVQLIANAVVLNVLAGKTAEELESYVSCASSVSDGCEANAYPLLDVFDRSSRIMLFWRMSRRGVRSLIPLLPSTPRGWHPSRATYSSYEWIRYDLTALPVNALLVVNTVFQCVHLLPVPCPSLSFLFPLLLPLPYSSSFYDYQVKFSKKKALIIGARCTL